MAFKLAGSFKKDLKMREIKSTANELVKETVKLHQKKYRDKFILIEGKKAVEEAITAKLKVKYIFVQNENEYKKYETYLVSEAVLKKVSTTESPANVVGVFEKPVYCLDAFKKFKKIVLLDNIKDAGNLGTIIRACSAFGIEGILLFGDTTDEFSPKTIRSSAGNMFKIPVLKIKFEELKEFKKTHRFLATVCRSDKFLNDYKIKSDLIVMFGSEADGLCKELLNLADDKVTIKMANNVESLNLALSAGVVLYELQNL